ncbi:MAG: hypothetical protein M1817_003386 [Caeruleum heppii]|nr:MAG: hypothetical protein M1817_003386 [Caeruleum heppii]
MSDEETDDDDLEITNVVTKTTHPVHKTTAGDQSTETPELDLVAPNAPAPSADDTADIHHGSKITWSDGESDNAYQDFRNHKSAKRKRGTASSRTGQASDKSSKTSHAARARDATSATLNKTTSRQKEEVEVDGTKESLPGYILTRRKRFDKGRERWNEAGLRLPPDFDDLDVSDTEDPGHVQERPVFPKGEPSAPYKEIRLPYSLGVIPAPIAQWLRDYQVQGVAFLHELFVYQRGGILGDDMGLGKTIQVVGFLTAAFSKRGDEHDAKRMRKVRRAGGDRWYPRVLILCPGSLIENWRSELDRWGWWHIDVYHGDQKEAALDTARNGRLEIMITTYATYRLNKSAVNMVDWDCVIADECHIIKERTSEITHAMNEVNALCRIGLTGTAIQNRYEELWTLLNWTNPGTFGPVSTWKTSISEPLRIGQSHDATVQQLSRARKTAKKLVENLLPDYFLRRMKTLIADQLPKKSDKVVFCPLTETQRDAYERYLQSDVVRTIRTSSEPCPCGSKKKKGWCCNVKVADGGRWQHHVFPAIMNLQKLSNHLAILIPQGSESKEKQAKDLETLQLALPEQWRELYQHQDSILNFSKPEFCGKWKVLKKLLRFWHSNGDKVLVFSHSVRLLKMLQSLFNHTSYNVSYLDGGMTYEDRAKTVDEFNRDSGQFVFLISTKAGGVGLNITSANKVVIVDPNWNPSYDLQAQDRAYRIGQVRDVEVFRLVSAGTIEEIVYARQIYKQQQANIGYNASTERRYFRGVQQKQNQKGEIFGLPNLLSFHGDDVVLRDIVNKTNVAEARAGVAVVGLDVDEQEAADDGLDADDEGKSMSQLAALVGEDVALPVKKKARPTTRSDAVQAILASAGVEYTHENSEVIGSSRVEARLSRQAEQTGHHVDRAEAYVFHHSQEAGVSESRPSGEDGVTSRYHPPTDVMKRQFCTMSRAFGFAHATDFALVVESWTQAQRRDCLEKFYRLRRDMLQTSEHGDDDLSS